MSHKLANGMKRWKGNLNTTTLLFSLKGLEILNEERRGQVKTIVMEHFNSILFCISGPANQELTNQSSINSSSISNGSGCIRMSSKYFHSMAEHRALVGAL